MTTTNVQFWVSLGDSEASEYLQVLVPEAGDRALRSDVALPVFLARWFGITPDEAEQAIQAAVQQGLIERDGDGDTYHAIAEPAP
jgi:hypothetical protein